MIGQSGLPMMNNLAGSNEKTPEEIKPKTATVEAGVFEKILVPKTQALAATSDPETLAEVSKELPKSMHGMPPIDAKSLGNVGARTQIEPRQLVGPQFKTPSDAKIATQPDPKSLVFKPATAAIEATKGGVNSPKHPENTDQIRTKASLNNGAELPSLKAETIAEKPESSASETSTRSEGSPDNPDPQSLEPEAQTPAPEILFESADQSNSPNGNRSGLAEVDQTQTKANPPLPEARPSETNSQSVRPVVEASKLAATPSDPEAPAAPTNSKLPTIDLQIGERDLQTSQLTAPLLNNGFQSIAATQHRGDADSDTRVHKADGSEASVRLPATQPSELKGPQPQIQIETVQNQPKPLSSHGDLRSAAAWIGATSPSDPNTASLIVPSSSADGSGSKAMMPTPTPQIQSLVPETSFFAQSALSDQSEGVLTPSAAITSTASSRLDGPASSTAPLNASADAKQVVHQINQAIIRMDGTRTEITLDPVELGRVSLTFITKDDGVTVVINADRSETADLLRRNGEQLQRDLSNAGYDGVELDFDEGDDAQPDLSATDRFDDSEPSHSSSVSYEGDLITSGLDIRI